MTASDMLATGRDPRANGRILGELVPPGVVAVEAFDDAIAVELFPAEARLVSGAVDKRRREFATARRCAREALLLLGHLPSPLLPGEGGAPIWPPGAVGSLTHCDGYRGAAVAAARDVWTLGVDAEPNQPLPDGVLSCVASSSEAAALTDLAACDTSVNWDRLLFSAKEAVYKAWFPLAKRWLGFHEAITVLDPHNGRFYTELVVPGPVVDDAPVTGFSGRWSATDGLLLTVVALPRARQ